jgi:hypothetical protein
MKFTEMIDEYRRHGLQPRMACTAIGAVYMPTTFMMTVLKNNDPQKLNLPNGAIQKS